MSPEGEESWRGWLKYVVLLPIFLTAAFCFDYFKTVDVRTDSGVLRYRFLGIPYRYDEHWPIVQERLRRAAQLPPPLTGQWVTCGSVPNLFQEDSGTDRWWYGFWDFYQAASAWSSVDPRITRLVMEDIARFAIVTHGGAVTSGNGWPAGEMIGPGTLRYDHGEYIVPEDWRNNEYVREYLRSKGYSLPEGGGGSGPGNQGWKQGPPGQR
jgi:hypothetical protein